MKNVLLFSLVFGSFFLTDAFSGTYEIADGAKSNRSEEAFTGWGRPYIDGDFIQDANREPLGFRIKQGWGCCSSLSCDKLERLTGADRNESRIYPSEANKDDVAIIAFVARKIYEHGGRFCLTQLSASSTDNRGFPLAIQQPNWPGMPCVTLCEPGWDGPECNDGPRLDQTGLDTACDTTDIKASIDKVRQSVYDGNDSIILNTCRPGAAKNMEFFERAKINDWYEHVIFLGGTEFNMQHGITAQPMLVAVVGKHPAVTWLTSGPANSGKSKVLCAQGFTRNDNCEVSSKNCGSNVWCEGYSQSDYDEKIHRKEPKFGCNVIVCIDGAKALDDNFNCVSYHNAGVRSGRCDNKEKDKYGRLVDCKVGEIFESETCECVAAKSVSKEIMQFGLAGKNTTLVNDQCWTKETTNDFMDCVFGNESKSVSTTK